MSFLREKSKVSGADWFLVTALFILSVIAFLIFGFSAIENWLNSLGPQLEGFALKNGYWGAFIVTFISNVSVIIVIPYGSVLFVLGSIGLNPWFFVITAGLAAALGEATGYWLGRGTRHLISSQQYTEKLERLNSFFLRKPKLTPLLIYLFGLTPIPDDIIMIPLGLIKYNFWKAIIPNALGKISLTVLVVLAGRFSYHFFTTAFGSEGGIWAGLLTLFLTIVIIYLTIKIKWDKLIK